MSHLTEHSPRLVGRYVVHDELASGGMATVHFGRLSGPVGFSRTVAIKKLHPHYAKDPEFVSMFLDEARLVARIRHPNVVPTLDVVATDAEIFIVMEYVAGEALSKLMKAATSKAFAMPPKIAGSILSSVLHGLHAAHQTKDEHGRELGIVHRDVSPQNVLVGTDGTARVLDFGVAKAQGRVQTTREGQLKGKIAYMPPEQLNGAPATRQFDIYAAAVVLWEALAGRRLFDGETEAVVLARAIEGNVDPPSLHNPLIDGEVDTVVLRGLARKPSDRYETARDMALAIEQKLGLASSSEVGEWVERVASEELHRRAQTIAQIEVASASDTLDDVANVMRSTNEVHSQVSSMSISKPASAQREAAPRSKTRVLLTAFGLLALAGCAFGGLALRDVLAGARHGEPNQVESERRRGFALMGPPMAAERALGIAPTTTTTTATAAPVVARVFVPAPRAPTSQATATSQLAPKGSKCDPPYTVDTATGHRVYKRECLQQP